MDILSRVGAMIFTGAIFFHSLFLYGNIIASNGAAPDRNQSSSSSFDHYVPNMKDENTFIQKTQKRMNQLEEQNRKMIEGDQVMMQEGYDPNEINPRSKHQDQKL